MSISSQTLLILTIFVCPYKTINSHRKEIGPNGEDIWRSITDFIPIQSQSFGTIKLGQVMSTEFDFIWSGRSNYPRVGVYENFFRVGYDASIDANCYGEGARYPSFWLTNDEDTLHVSTSSGKTCQPIQSLRDYGVISTSISYHIKISFNNTQLVVEISGEDRAIWTKAWNREPIDPQHLGETVPIWWMSNKHSGTLYNAGRGIFSNIIIKSAIFSSTSNPTSYPTPYPTPHPTSDPLLLSTYTIVPTPSVVSITHITPVLPTYYSSLNPTYLLPHESLIHVTGTVLDFKRIYVIYIHNHTNMVLLSVTTATCILGICLMRSVMKMRKRLYIRNRNPTINSYITDEEIHTTDYGDIGEDGVLLNDLENKEDDDDDGEDVIETVPGTGDMVGGTALVLTETVLEIFDAKQQMDAQINRPDVFDIEMYRVMANLIAPSPRGDVKPYYD